MSGHCGKAFLYIYNLIYLGIACVLVYLAIQFVETWGNYTQLTADTYSIVPAGIILGAAVILLVASCVGCCGTCTDNRCCLGVFFTFLLTVLALELVCGSLGYVYRDKIQKEIKLDLKKAMVRYPMKNEEIIKQSFDMMQSKLKCCGVDGALDWKNVTGVNDVPKSCCRHGPNECGYDFPSNIYQDGCYKMLIQMFMDYLNYIAGVGIGFAIFQIVGMMGTCYLIFTMGKIGYKRIEPSRV